MVSDPMGSLDWSLTIWEALGGSENLWEAFGSSTPPIETIGRISFMLEAFSGTMTPLEIHDM